jgi:hypothetical protein
MYSFQLCVLTLTYAQMVRFFLLQFDSEQQARKLRRPVYQGQLPIHQALASASLRLALQDLCVLDNSRLIRIRKDDINIELSDK